MESHNGGSQVKKILPMNDRVLVHRDPPEDTTKSGIVIPDIAKEKLNRGTVIAVGPGKVLDSGRRVEPLVKTGDRVLFGKYSGSEFESEGEQRLFLTSEEILGVIEED